MKKKRSDRRPLCVTCVYLKHRPRPDLKVPCVKVKRKPHMLACTRYYRPLVCLECVHYVLRTCRLVPRELLVPYRPAYECSSFIDREKMRVHDASPLRLSGDEAENFLKEGFREILTRVFAIEKASVQAVEEIAAELEKQGVVVPFARTEYERLVSLITRVYLINQLSQLCGVGHLLDEILDYELNKRKDNKE